MPFDDLGGYRDEVAVNAIRASHPSFAGPVRGAKGTFAHVAYPFIRAYGRVSAFTGPPAFETPGVHVFAAAEKRME